MADSNVPPIPGFQLRSSVGHGSFGEVYSATLPDGTPCAIKRFSSMAIDRMHVAKTFHQYWRIPERHSGLVHLLDWNFEQAPYYCASEWMGDFQRLEDCPAPLPEPEAWALLEQIADALAHLHKHGVTHGNLHPGNIFVRRDKDETVVKVAEFGACYKEGIHYLDLRENAYFASPEQLLEPAGIEAGLGPRWDVYRFGAIAFWLITGKLPRGRGYRNQRAHQQANSDGRYIPVDPQEFAQDCLANPDFEWTEKTTDRAFVTRRELVEKCLAINTAERPVDLRDVVHQFRELDAQFSLEDAEKRIAAERRRQHGKLAATRALSFVLAVLLIAAGVHLTKHLLENRAYSRSVAALDETVVTQREKIEGIVAQSKELERDLKESRAAADQFFARLAQDGFSLNGKPCGEMTPARLLEAEEYYQRTLEQVSTEPENDVERARCMHSLAHIENCLERRDKALAMFEKSALLLTSILKKEDLGDLDREDSYERLADCYLELAELYTPDPDDYVLRCLQLATRHFTHLTEFRARDRALELLRVETGVRLAKELENHRRFEESVNAYAEAAVLLENLKGWEETAAQRLDLRADIQYHTALALRKLERNAEAIDAHLAALETLGEIRAKTDGYGPGQRLRMALSYTELGELFAAGSQEDKAPDIHNEALRVLLGLSETQPDSPEIALALARNCRDVARLQAKSGQSGEAQRLSQSALETLEEIAQTHPDNLACLFALAEAQVGHAELLGVKGKTAGGYLEKSMAGTEKIAETVSKAAGSLPSAQQRNHQIRLAGLYHHLGDLAEQRGEKETAKTCYSRAVKEWEFLAKNQNTSDRTWIEASLNVSRNELRSLQ